MRGRSVTPSWKRDADRALDGELRAARPRPRAEFTQAIADRVRSRDSAGKRRFGRLQLALGVGLSALFLAPVVAAGFGGLGTNGKSAKLTSSERAAYIKSGSGRALRSVSPATSKRAATSRRRAGRPGRSQAAASIAPGGGGSAFIAGIIEPQEADDALLAQYAPACTFEGTIIQTNTGTITQGGNTATGGAAMSTGGDGGDASTGNIQTDNGNVLAEGGGIANGGKTSATSGAATGGNGGNAIAIGGSAEAENEAVQVLVNNVC